jgi:CheY-like chemotaxis protein
VELDGGEGYDRDGRVMSQPSDLGPPPRPRRVLIIDDHADTADSLAICLRAAGHRVEVAADGIAGLDTARRFLPEVVFCDVGLPGVDGHYVARALKSDPNHAGCYIVAVTGSHGAEAGRDSGFDEYLLKPVDLTVLAAAVARAPQRE